MSYKRYPPCRELEDVVQYFWSAEINCGSDNFYINTFVDDSTGIIFHHNEGHSVLQSSDIHLPKAIIYGQITSPSASFSTSSFSVVGVLFYPYVINGLWKFAASDLTDNVQKLENVLNIGTLTDTVINTQNVMEQIQLISWFLLKFVKRTDVNDSWVKDAVSYIKSQNGLLRVSDVSEYFKISERKLERDFKEAIGVTPKHYLQVSRFQKVLQELKKEDVGKLTALAYDYNFSDQPHFNRTFRKLSGFNPRKLKSLLNEDVVNLIT
ncbi:helix-turn-helix domain-containing protein [Bizionia paragorgiae]|uniref:helix-turn-helix domain-containing protein n=1 Tax=Bizionia paragorgiae TaxID=283786 RepID=UPI003A928EDB